SWMRNCPTYGRIWRRPTWDWANRETRWTLYCAFPRRLRARPARIRRRVRRRLDEKERRRSDGATGRLGDCETMTGSEGATKTRELEFYRPVAPSPCRPVAEQRCLN